MGRENLSIRLAERPTDNIIPGKTFKQVREPAPTADDLKDNEILVEALYLSLDPAMRGWLNGMYRCYSRLTSPFPWHNPTPSVYMSAYSLSHFIRGAPNSTSPHIR